MKRLRKVNLDLVYILIGKQCRLPACVPEEDRAGTTEIAGAGVRNQTGHGFRRICRIEEQRFVACGQIVVQMDVLVRRAAAAVRAERRT